jgi:hypothetical protein
MCVRQPPKGVGCPRSLSPPTVACLQFLGNVGQSKRSRVENVLPCAGQTALISQNKFTPRSTHTPCSFLCLLKVVDLKKKYRARWNNFVFSWQFCSGARGHCHVHFCVSFSPWGNCAAAASLSLHFLGSDSPALPELSQLASAFSQPFALQW